MWPCLRLCTASWKDEFAAVIYIYEFMPFGPVWNDGSFPRSKRSWCWIYNRPRQPPPLSPQSASSSSSLSPYSTCLDLLNMDGGGGMGRREKRERTFLSLRWLLSPVSHLRKCGTGINGIQEPGEIAAGGVCLPPRASYMCAAGEVQDLDPWQSQSVYTHRWWVSLRNNTAVRKHY